MITSQQNYEKNRKVFDNHSAGSIGLKRQKESQPRGLHQLNVLT
jgi:hypothetical protein